jgi:SAM-dependent methyltransferase
MSDFHRYFNGLSPDVGSVVRPADWRLDAGLVRRIKRAYRLALEKSEGPGASMWTTIFRERQQPVVDALMSTDDAVTASALSNPAHSELYYGMDSLHRASSQLMKTVDPPRSILAYFVLDTFAKLAEATGARCAWNPEAVPKRPFETDLEAVLASLNVVLGINVEFPNPFNDEFGIKTTRGVIGQRGPLSLYQAWRSVQLCRFVEGSRILEIGAGVGRTAYYARLMGIKDYTIVDLPLGNVGQAVFLGAALGPDAVWMPGDPSSDQPGKIRLFPPDWIRDTAENFDLIANVDSMTEMSREQAIEYFRFFYRHGKVFLSINHEANPFRVYDLPRMANLSVKGTRHGCLVRPGYMEECFFSPTARR